MCKKETYFISIYLNPFVQRPRKSTSRSAILPPSSKHYSIWYTPSCYFCCFADPIPTDLRHFISLTLKFIYAVCSWQFVQFVKMFIFVPVQQWCFGGNPIRSETDLYNQHLKRCACCAGPALRAYTQPSNLVGFTALRGSAVSSASPPKWRACFFYLLS